MAITTRSTPTSTTRDERAALVELRGASNRSPAHSHAAEAASAERPEIDDGMRRWYESCSCCLSDAYPDVKAALDAERAASSQPTADPGVCEVAEAAEAKTANA